MFLLIQMNSIHKKHNSMEQLHKALVPFIYSWFIAYSTNSEWYWMK